MTFWQIMAAILFVTMLVVVPLVMAASIYREIVDCFTRLGWLRKEARDRLFFPTNRQR